MRSRKLLFAVSVVIVLAVVLVFMFRDRSEKVDTYTLLLNDNTAYTRPEYPVEFVREQVALDVYGDSVTVTGTYWFRVNDDRTGRFPITYPFPVDEQHAYPSHVQVSGADGEPIPCSLDTTATSVHFPLDLESPSFTVTYTQHISGTNASYILTTTAAWEQPLEHAEFTVSLPEEYRLASLSYDYDDVHSQDERMIYSFARDQFMPVRDLVVSWME